MGTYAQAIREVDDPFTVLDGLFDAAVARYNKEQHQTPDARVTREERTPDAARYRLEADDLPDAARYEASTRPRHAGPGEILPGRVVAFHPVGARRLPMKLRTVLDEVVELTAPDDLDRGEDAYTLTFERDGH